MFSKLISSSSVFVTSSPSNIPLVHKWDRLYNQKIQKLLEENIEKTTDTYKPILYLTPKFTINNIQDLFTSNRNTESVRMFRNNIKYLLLDESKYDFEQEETDSSASLFSHQYVQLLEQFEELYPKRKAKIRILFKSLYNFCEEYSFLDNSGLYLTSKVNDIKYSFYDIISASQNPGKKKLDAKLKSLLLEIAKQGLRLPRLTLINQEFKRLLT